jgi:hypothetical protein
MALVFLSSQKFADKLTVLLKTGSCKHLAEMFLNYLLSSIHNFIKIVHTLSGGKEKYEP